ncbi:Arsenate reductase [Klebsiella quasipneumoniae]|nr:Arsenate reductase [Klebsiella quasipneumoniae]
MTDAVKIYHNPRCSKSRETLSLLKSHGIDPEVVLYLETPPDAGTLRQLLQLLVWRAPASSCARKRICINRSILPTRRSATRR